MFYPRINNYIWKYPDKTARAHWKELYLISIQDILTNVVFWFSNKIYSLDWQRQETVLFQLSFISDWKTLKRRFKAQRWATTAPILYRSTLRALPTKPRVTSSTAQRLSGQKISETIRSKIIRDYYQVKNIQTLSGQKISWSREIFVFNWIESLKFQ